MTKFVVMMPVDIEVRDPQHLRNMWACLRDSGGACTSTDGWNYDLRSDRLTLKAVREAYRVAVNGSENSR